MVSTSYKIKDVADRSGFSAATLRYYDEEIGLLPESTRTPAGYRVFDDCTLDRLAFIARAKRLGCTLDEIGDLTLAWDGGQCGPVQDRLRGRRRRQTQSMRSRLTDWQRLLSHIVRREPLDNGLRATFGPETRHSTN